MRVMVRFQFPVESGNEAIRSGKVNKVFETLLAELKPEAAYFFPEGGQRGGLIVVDMQASSQIAEVAERLFFGLNADVEMTPVMTPEDLQKGLAGIDAVIRNYG